MSESIALVNGNKQPYTVPLPRLVWLTRHVNDVALAHVKENTGLDFQKCTSGLEVVPETSQQVVALLLTYNFKTQYHNNATTENTIYLKCDHHIGFKIDSVCFDCLKHNHVNTMNLKPGDRLAC